MFKIFCFFIGLFFISFSELRADDGYFDIANGKIKSQVCTTCHGSDGNSFVPIWPKISGQVLTYMTRQLNSFKLDGKDGRSNPLMYNIVKDLSDKDLSDISMYYSTGNGFSGNSNEDVVLNDINNGRSLYLHGDSANNIPSCSACHGFSGEGNDFAGFPRLKNQHLEYIVQQLQNYKDCTRFNDYNMIMRDVASKLSDKQILDVAKYIAFM
jgi:cytochrome c553